MGEKGTRCENKDRIWKGTVWKRNGCMEKLRRNRKGNENGKRGKEECWRKGIVGRDRYKVGMAEEGIENNGNQNFI